MHITINRGTTDVIIDINDLIDLLKDKLVTLDLVTDHDVSSCIMKTQKTIVRLQEYLLSLSDDEDYPCDIVNEF